MLVGNATDCTEFEGKDCKLSRWADREAFGLFEVGAEAKKFFTLEFRCWRSLVFTSLRKLEKFKESLTQKRMLKSWLLVPFTSEKFAKKFYLSKPEIFFDGLQQWINRNDVFAAGKLPNEGDILTATTQDRVGGQVLFGGPKRTQSRRPKWRRRFLQKLKKHPSTSNLPMDSQIIQENILHDFNSSTLWTSLGKNSGIGRKGQKLGIFTSAGNDNIQKLGLRLNESQTVVSVFTNKKFIPPILTINGTQLQINKSIKYLGVTFDDKLSFVQYMRLACEKAERRINQLSRLFARTYGYNFSSRRIVVQGAINSILLYCSIVTHEVLEYQYIKKLLKKLQRKTSIIITSAYTSLS